MKPASRNNDTVPVSSQERGRAHPASEGSFRASRVKLDGLIRQLLGALLGLLLTTPAWAAPFDHQHAAWSALLKAHVVVAADGTSSRVDYAGFKTDQVALSAYLATLSAVSDDEYTHWTAPQRLAFLINAYNAFTVSLILTRYPDVTSIKDLGSLFSSPWRKSFFTLRGEQHSLDDIEHKMIRAPGAFHEPRIHFSVVCASIGCPMLRDEAYVADRLEAQLEDGLRRFLSDRSRNRFNPATGRLEVSHLFDWYQGDFTNGPHGLTSVAAALAKYADRLTDDPVARTAIQAGTVPIAFLDYDWRLNDTGGP